MNAKERKALVLAEGTLELVQWAGGDEEWVCCLWCGGLEPVYAESHGLMDGVGHSPTCPLAPALAAIKEALFEDGKGDSHE